MIQKSDIPELAVCQKCGNPMKVIDVAAKARALGVYRPEGSFVIECCGAELTIEDEDAAQRLRDLLLAYHAAHSATKDETLRLATAP